MSSKVEQIIIPVKCVAPHQSGQSNRASDNFSTVNLGPMIMFTSSATGITFNLMQDVSLSPDKTLLQNAVLNKAYNNPGGGEDNLYFADIQNYDGDLTIDVESA